MKLTVSNLATDRGERRIFEGVSFSLAAGEALVVTGANGSGKSTMLKVLAGLLRAASGTISLSGGEVDASLAEQCHYLSHNNALKPSLSVEENLSFWAQFLGAGLPVDDALARVGLAGIGSIPAGYLSAGQKRRVAIARLLVARKPVWLVDEPTAALDKASEKMFAGMVMEHLATGGIVIAATHQPLELASPKRLDMAQHVPIQVEPV